MNKYLNRLRLKRRAKQNPFASAPTADSAAHGAVNVMVADLMERLLAAMDEVQA